MHGTNPALVRTTPIVATVWLTCVQRLCGKRTFFSPTPPAEIPRVEDKSQSRCEKRDGVAKRVISKNDILIQQATLKFLLQFLPCNVMKEKPLFTYKNPKN